MPTFGPDTARCRIFTQKVGVLAAVAHDLEIEATRFSIDATDSKVRARFDATGLRVTHALKDGRPFDALSENDKLEIQRTIAHDVLDAARFPLITFESSSISRAPADASLEGALTLHGVRRPIRAKVRTEGASYEVEVPIHQPDYGIKPYTALMGTLKVKPEILVRISVPRW